MNAPTSFYWSLIVYPLFPIDAKRVSADFEAFQQRTISGYCRKTCFGEVSDRSFGRFVGNAEVGFLLAGCRAGREQFNRSVSQVKFRLMQFAHGNEHLAVAIGRPHAAKGCVEGFPLLGIR